MLICPGGGYHDLFWELEGEEVASWLNSLGMTGIILEYRCPRRPGDVKGEPPLGPLTRRSTGCEPRPLPGRRWGDRPATDRHGRVSAGGHLALATATSFEKRMYEPIDAIDEVSCRPDFAVLCYSGYLKAKDKDGEPRRASASRLARLRSSSPILPTTTRVPAGPTWKTV